MMTLPPPTRRDLWTRILWALPPVIVDYAGILAAERFGGLEVDEQEDVGLMPLLPRAATSLGIQLLVRAWANDGAALGLSAR
jgi:hypothetical protein